MLTIWAILSLTLPAFSAVLICCRLGKWGSQAANILVGLVLYVGLFIIPIHVIATLQFVGLFDTFSLLTITILDAFILFGLFTWNTFKPTTTDFEFGKFSFLSYFKELPRSVLISFGIVAGCYLVFAGNLFTSYPQGPDGVYYRLPLAVRWLQNGSLSIPANTWRYALPGNAEIPMMVLLGTGWHSSVLVFNFVGTIILACSTYLIALKCNVSRAAALVVSTILVSVPLINFQTFLVYTEVYGSSFILAAIAFFLYRYDQENTSSQKRFLVSLVLAGLSIGLAIGTKVAFLVYGAAFFAIVVFMLFRERDKHRKSPAFIMAILAAAILGPCVFWFGRAFFTTGNPLYPIKVELLGRTIFDGYTIELMRPSGQFVDFVENRIGWLFYPWTETNNRQANYSERGGLGATFAAVVPLGVLYTILTSFRNRAKNKDTLIRALVSFLFAGLLAFFLVFSQTPRYSIPALAFACILSAPLIDVLLKSRPRFFGVLLISAFTTTSLIAAFSPMRSLLGRASRGEWTRHEIYQYPEIFDDLPAGSTVLNLGRLHLNNFALSGKHLRSKVIPFFEQPLFRRKEGFLGAQVSEDFLRKNRVDYIVQRKSDYYDYIVQKTKRSVVSTKSDEFAEKNPYPKDLDPGILLDCVYDESWSDPATKNPWRVWKVMAEPEPKFPSAVKSLKLEINDG